MRLTFGNGEFLGTPNGDAEQLAVYMGLELKIWVENIELSAQKSQLESQYQMGIAQGKAYNKSTEERTLGNNDI